MDKVVVDFRIPDHAEKVQVEIIGDIEAGAMKENCRYEYELRSGGYSLRAVSGIISHSKIKGGNERGLIEPGNYVGLLKLDLCNENTQKRVSFAYVDVRSRKLNYETEYRSMLEDVANRCADFLLQLESPSDILLLPDNTINPATLAQRMYFLKSLLGGEDFQQALQRIISMPNTRWRQEMRTVDVRSSARLGRHEARQFATALRRMEVASSHPLCSLMSSIPEKIEVRDKRDTVDTPENRFVKHALGMFLHTLEDLQKRLWDNEGSEIYPGLRVEIEELASYLEETLADDLFKEVARPEILPLNSPVLQRREGYRQILRAWMLFDLAARLSWTGGDDVYAGGKRDVAALYEYWVFFKLLDLVSILFDLKNKPVEELIDSRNLVLKLKAGRQLVMDGVYTGAGRPLEVRFSYNKTFTGDREYPAQGSWSRQMRPDYTLSLWPKGFSEKQAEEQELMTHVHFDAKYKVENITELFGAAENDLDAEKREQRAGNYKRADLLKMHAYRDAIRRTAGAYVLYPGVDKPSEFKGFHELLPGLGAFPLRPGVTDDGSSALNRFLKEVVAHVCNRATQHEQHTYHTYRIHKEDPPEAVKEAIPETVERYRVPPPNEIFVLHGWHNGERHLEWVVSKGLYNFRTEKDRGSLRLHHSVAGASYLLLHGAGEYQGGGRLFKISSEGPRVLSKETLVALEYPGGARQPYYLVFDVKPLDEDDPLAGYDWDLRPIDGIDEGRASAVPKKGISLSDFMKGARQKV